MKDLLMLWSVVANEYATRCHTSATLDIKTVEGRSNKEGIEFLTIALPEFHASFVKALDCGTASPSDLFLGFARKGRTPKFLGGFMDQVFDRKTGHLLDAPDVEAITAVRQLSLLFGKINLPCSQARIDKAFQGYINVERQIEQWDAFADEVLLSDFLRITHLVWGDVLAQLERVVKDGHITPKHGPGATADRLTGNRKFDLRYWPERLEAVFPYLENALPNYSHWRELQDRVDLVEPGAEIPVKVISVPKTPKAPRLIAKEPTANQYMQQGLMEWFVRFLESDPRKFVGILDQGPNQALAKEGSLTGALATLDLSEASDRVSNLLVRKMLCNFPYLGEAVAATRSEKADVQGHGIVNLSKFASMGSALTFPIEAMVFTVIVLMGVEKSLKASQSSGVPTGKYTESGYFRPDGRVLNQKALNNLAGTVRVYGDDIIVPVEHVYHVNELLRRMGLVVNQGKSFSEGNFRESCGKDYYAGEDVTIVRVRRIFPRSRLDVAEVVSLVSLRNQCYMHGLWDTANWLDDAIVKILPHFPTVSPTSPVLGRWSLLGYETQRIHPNTHSPLVKGYVARAKAPDSNVSGIGALMKCFLKRGEEPFFDVKHLERQGRPEAVDIKLRWSSPF